MQIDVPDRPRADLSLEAPADRFRAFVRGADFPCVGAKSALNRNRMEFSAHGQLGHADDAAALCRQLENFSAKYPVPGLQPVSHVAMFSRSEESENAFHMALWTHLQAMHHFDRRYHAWDAGVSANADAPDFSFSIAGRAFFVVGLHPLSSRLSRRAPFPCLVFNFHDQFEAMRASGLYDQLKTAVRQRDIVLQGDINPVLATFGEGSEARQYSGRADAANVGCPFKAVAA